jgi:hypothetical protein
MAMKWVVFAAATAVALAFVGWSCMPPRLTVPEPEAARRDPVTAVAATSAKTIRQAVELPVPSDSADTESSRFDSIPAHAEQHHVTVRGRVIKVTGTPVGGVEVHRTRPRRLMPDGSFGAPSGSAWSVVADAAGRFEVEGVPPFVLGVSDETYGTYLEGYVSRSTEEVLVVVAVRIPLAGIVVDQAGSPVEGVRVTIAANAALPLHDLTGSRLVLPEARSDALGLFRFENAVAVPQAMMQFEALGFPVKAVPVPAGGDPAMTVVMLRETDNVYAITGQVVLADGSPAVGAFVSIGSLASMTDAQGLFLIDLERWLAMRVDEAAPTIVTAVRSGLLPVSRTLPSVQEARASGWPKSIVLRLVGVPLTITGVVVDDQGAPMSGVLVEPDDMTAFGFVRRPGMPALGGSPKTQEQLAGGKAVRTGADGCFALGGLLDRNYTIRALVKPSLLTGVSGPVAAGSQGVRLVLKRSSIGTIAGRIIDRSGVGIGGVRVAVSCERTSELVIGRAAVSAADGTFAIVDVTTTPAFLRIEGAAIVTELFHKLGPNDDPANLVLRVGMRRRIQVAWGAQLVAADRLFVVDADGKELMMMRLRGGSIGEAPFLVFRRGLSEVVAVPDGAVTAIVRRDGLEVTRVRLQLAAGEVSLIRL